jgi:hypothetical protein
MKPLVFLLVYAISISTALAADERVLPAQGQLSPVVGVDLGIADDETFRRPNSWSELAGRTKFAGADRLLPTESILAGDFSGPASRPGMSIAWRNAAQVEEVEVRVRNLGDQAAEGRIWVQVLDEGGSQLLRLEPPDELQRIRLPAFSNGGREGKVIRMKASRELNNIIDQFDRERRRYDVRATVETLGAQDVNLRDNSKTKSWNIPYRVEPGLRNTFNYKFRNHESRPVTVKWLFERTPYPTGWQINGVPETTDEITIAPGSEIRGTLWMDAPNDIVEGAFVEARLSLLDAATGMIWQQHEWFQVYDTIPPKVTDYRIATIADRKIAIQALVSDQGSGVLEATGVSTQYSTDGGRTWAGSSHNYKVGNFVVPTLFEVVLGPFASGTDVQLRFNARDTAGNSTSLIPEVASAIRVPPGGEKLLDLAYVFPRTQPNAVFALDPGQIDPGHIASQFSAAIAQSATEPERVETLVAVLQSVPITEENKQKLLESAQSLATDPSRANTAARFQQIITGLTAAPSDSLTVTPLQVDRIVAPGAALLKMSTIGLKLP